MGAESSRGSGHWSVPAMREVQRLLARTEFAAAATLAGECAARAAAEGDTQSWRRFSCREATAEYNVGRFTDALRTADAVVASAPADEHLDTRAHALNIGTIAADRLGLDDTLLRLDAAIDVGERILREQGRPDSLHRTAWTAGTLGLAELGEAIFAEITVEAGEGAETALPPVTGAFLVIEQLTVRNWWALGFEHAGDPRATEVFERNIRTVRGLPEVLPMDRLPGSVVAALRGFEALALVGVGRPDEVAEPLRVAETVPHSEAPDVVSTAALLLAGAARMRLTPTADPLDALAESAEMVRLAGRIGDRRGEAEHLRLAAVAARRTGEPTRIAVAEGRFEALVERLDWARRLQAARMMSVRSRALRHVARAVVGEDDPAAVRRRERPHPRPHAR